MAPARILIVDDEPSTRVLAQELELLEQEGLPAANGRGALEVLRAKPWT